MLPDLREQFDVDSATISWTISAYLLPMAGLLLVSGTLGERFGRSRVLRASLAVYLVACILVAVAPSLPTFLVARALQGAANAFFTPLLLAALTDITPEDQLGRRIGMYSSFQAVGGAGAPFIGGLSAEIDWRVAFVVTAVITALILVSSPGSHGSTRTERPPIRPLFAPRLLALGLASLSITAGPLGAQVLLGLKLRDVLDIEPGPAGLILSAGFVGPILLGPSLGRLTDRFGPRWCGVLATIAVGLVVALMGPVDSTIALTVLWVLAGSLSALVTVVLHRVAAVIVPANRGGALSAVLSFRFLGFAIGPLIWVPVLTTDVNAAFVGSALLGLMTLAGLLSSVPARAPTPETGPGSAGPGSGRARPWSGAEVARPG
jgi:MFS family permease